MLPIHAIPALGDNLNYIWLIQSEHNNTVLIVDPGEATPVFQALSDKNLHPTAILITHHHWDHVNGIADLVAHYNIPVYVPKNETVPCRTHSLTASDMVHLPNFPPITVLDIPGHTEGHIAYLVAGHLFCGDTLFGAGCGRLLGGTAEQLYTSLQHIMALPMSTKIYCGHEYTADNLRFATMIEPNNIHISQRILDVKQKTVHPEPVAGTLPSTLELETQTNPFLRCHIPAVQQAAESYANKPLHHPLAVFTVLREWKTNV